jgi:hypothetical protein
MVGASKGQLVSHINEKDRVGNTSDTLAQNLIYIDKGAGLAGASVTSAAVEPSL